MPDIYRTFYCRLRGTTTGWAILTTSRDMARKITAAREVIRVDSSNIIISSQPALGISYAHISSDR